MTDPRPHNCSVATEHRGRLRSAIVAAFALFAVGACDQGGDYELDERVDPSECDVEQDDVGAFCSEFDGQFVTLRTHIDQGGEPVLTAGYVKPDGFVSDDDNVYDDNVIPLRLSKIVRVNFSHSPTPISTIQYAVECDVGEPSEPSVRLRLKKRYHPTDAHAEDGLQSYYLTMGPDDDLIIETGGGQDSQLWSPVQVGGLWSFQNLGTDGFAQSGGIWRPMASGDSANPNTQMLVEVVGSAG
ncbi:MAG: hypothetical protein K0V04_17065 [Deltaproteobacteria bacterium]|nr:hypothetical protein [Deltaproteobacteria bacterium]